MYPLLETIRFENGNFYHIDAHQQRLDRARREVWQCSDELLLSTHLQAPAEWLPGQRYKCRVVYGKQVQSISFEAYHIRPIQSLQLVEASGLEYAYKKMDRTALTALFAQRGSYDDVLLIQDGYITDSYYCNVAAWNGQGWFTPARPLLPGTQRARLLELGVLQTAEIHYQSLVQFEKLALFNALMGWEDRQEVWMENVSLLV
ncbi:aminotransferase class IV [Microscilla marina]|uniref:Putative para-aminobenzoate synthase component I n=1 Tax=Microscilla marina ATCC 23134 TaxID=313606 RepID=A1ZQ45_MICM2|nr:aminotransferase class IV [Microscilla marina]EAY27454.1 putative para-aminobenzoate synthase component I [Microscilla marina ATCC 23134]